MHHADGAGAEHESAVALLRVQVLLAVEDAGERLDERRVVGLQVVRDEDDVALGDDARVDLDVLGEPARIVVSDGREFVAEVVLLALAVDALAAPDDGRDDDLAAELEAADVLADLVDDADDLMSRDRGRNDVLLAMYEDAFVRAADGAPEDADDDLALSGRRLRDLFNSHVAGTVKNGCFHVPVLPYY